MTETFPIIPGQVRLFWVFVPLVIVLVGVGVLLALSFTGARNARFEVSSAGLRLRGDLYGRMIAARDLRVPEARAVNLTQEGTLMPRLRIGGTAVPGYRAGWFKLRNGERALLYLTDPTHVAYVPTRRGYSVMVSVADPDAFLNSLRSATTHER